MRAAAPRARPPPRRASTASTASAASSPSTASTASLTAPAPPSFPGARVESVVEKANMAINKNTVPGDKSAFIPGGIRIGTPALTSRGFEEAHFDEARRARNSGAFRAIPRNSAQFSAQLSAQFADASPPRFCSGSSNDPLRKCASPSP